MYCELFVENRNSILVERILVRCRLACIIQPLFIDFALFHFLFELTELV